MDIQHILVLCFLGTLCIQISQQTPSKCIPMPQPGMCRAYMPRFFFNATSEACEQFIYGGCGGNENNFKTQEECQTECITDGVNPCTLKPDVGMCRASIPRYFYNHTSGTCDMFTYGGCGGNDNNFETQAECSDKCVPSISQYNFQVPEHESFYHCFLKPEVGDCHALIPKYFYNSTLRGCQMFMYGGCRGNQNNFDGMEECTDSCNGADHCLLNSDHGDCFANIPRYFYNYTANKCEMFFFGGCRGNDNNFETPEICTAECARGNDASNLIVSVAVLLLSFFISSVISSVL